MTANQDPYDSQGNLRKATYAEAADEAVALAEFCDMPVSIGRSDEWWVILDFPAIAQVYMEREKHLAQMQEVERYESAEHDLDEDPDFGVEEDQARAERVEELNGYQDDMTRSNEEGWYYED